MIAPSAPRASLARHKPRKRSRRAPLVILLTAVYAPLAGCGEVLTSDLAASLSDHGDPRTGIAYALPRSVMDFTLSVDKDNARFSVTPSAPRAIADPYRRYFLRYQPLPNYDDIVSVTVTGQGFLKTISANTTDRTGDIILNLIKSVSAFGQPFEAAALPAADQQLARVTIDPSNPAEMAETICLFNEAVKRYAAKASKSCSATTVPPSKTIPSTEFDRRFTGVTPDLTKQSRCDEYATVKDRNHYINISLRPMGSDAVAPPLPDCERVSNGLPSVQRPPAVPPHREADCSVGICYRAPRPFILELIVGDSRARGVALLPNASPLVAVDIRRAFFINKVQTLEFDVDGSLKTMAVQKDSELLAISSFPVQVVSAIADSLRLRIQVLDQQIGYANATNDLLQAKADLEKQRVLFEGAEYQISGQRSTATSYSTVPLLRPSPAATAQAGTTAGTFLSSGKPITTVP